MMKTMFFKAAFAAGALMLAAIPASAQGYSAGNGYDRHGGYSSDYGRDDYGNGYGDSYRYGSYQRSYHRDRHFRRHHRDWDDRRHDWRDDRGYGW